MKFVNSERNEMILITGAAGFIGSAVVWELNRRGRRDLVLVDKLGSGDKWKNLLGLRFAEFIDREELFARLSTDKWASEIECVFHIGANADTTFLDGDSLYEWNYDFSRALGDWSLNNGIRFIYASSAAVYGDGALGFSDDYDLSFKLQPLNPYGFSKLLFDRYVIQNNWYDKVAGFRFFNVYGPNEYHKARMASVILHAIPQARDTGKIRLFESHRDGIAHGEQKRDFVSIWEVLDGLMFAFDHPKVNGIFNLGSGRAHSFNQLAEAVFSALDKPCKIEYFPMPEDLRGRYQYYTCADMSRLQKCGFPVFPDKFAEHVKEYVGKYIVHEKRLQ